MKHSQLQFGKKGGDGTPSVLTCEEKEEERTCEVEAEKDERVWEKERGQTKQGLLFERIDE